MSVFAHNAVDPFVGILAESSPPITLVVNIDPRDGVRLWDLPDSLRIAMDHISNSEVRMIL